MHYCKGFLLRTILFLLLFHAAVFSQDFVDISMTAGIGAISSNSPYISGFTSSVSLGAGNFSDIISTRLSFYYAGDFNALLPTSSRSHYPSITAFALKGIYAVNVTDNLFYEQGLGLYAANDNIYSTSSGWGGGFIVSALGGLDLRGDYYSGFRVGAGGEYGLTVYNIYVRYLSLYIQAQYIFSIK